jgi:hypothetical protein
VYKRHEQPGYFLKRFISFLRREAPQKLEKTILKIRWGSNKRLVSPVIL